MSGILIAIDGPAGSGKSSVARAVAAKLGVSNLNTGATYRAVAMLALKEGIETSDETALARLARRVSLDGEVVSVDGEPVPEADLRTPPVSAAASEVSSGAAVREVLVRAQREAAARARSRGGAVVEGRDIGTVVLPDAELKVFLSAAAEERARRRALQSGRPDEVERILNAIKSRDRRDTEREASPLRAAPDAVVVDTTRMTLREAVEEVLARARNLLDGRSG